MLATGRASGRPARFYQADIWEMTTANVITAGREGGRRAGRAPNEIRMFYLFVQSHGHPIVCPSRCLSSPAPPAHPLPRCQPPRQNAARLYHKTHRTSPPGQERAYFLFGTPALSKQALTMMLRDVSCAAAAPQQVLCRQALPSHARPATPGLPLKLQIFSFSFFFH